MNSTHEGESTVSAETMQPELPPAGMDKAVRALYEELIEGWNQHNADAMAAPFADDGDLVGFDGSQMWGRAEIAKTVGEIFAHHVTPPYFCKVRSVRSLGPEAALLRAVAGMVPPGKSDIEPSLNAIHTLVARQVNGQYRVVLFQNTPAQFHGRPDLVQQLTAELRELLP